MKREYIYFIVIIILVLLIFTSIFNKKDDTKNTNVNTKNAMVTNESNQEKTIPNGQIGIVKHKYNGNGIVDVYVKNNTGKTINVVKINATSYDKEGNNLGVTTGFQRNVNTNDTYKISVYVGTDMKKYNLKLEYE